MTDGKKAIDYMRKMATGCRWKVIREICYVKTDGSEFVLKPGVWYTGVPYTQGRKRRLYNLFRFRLQLLAGMFFMGKALVGNDCSSAASFAWRACRGDLPMLNTKKMYLDLCGPQKYFTNLDLYRAERSPGGTNAIISQNQSSDMEVAYEALRVGDGLLQYDDLERKGHIMLVSQTAQAGVIRIIDQKGFGENSSERDDTSWRIDYPFGFDTLREEGYVPLFLKHET